MRDPHRRIPSRLGATMVTLLVAALLLGQACGGGNQFDPNAPTAAQPATELTGILATTDLSVGDNRVSFLLTSPQRLITIPQASVASVYLPADGSSPVVREETTTSFHLWPYGTRGNYATHLTFDRPGDWQVNIEVQDEDGVTRTARIPLEVKERSITPAIGSRPPLTANKTLADVDKLEQLTSWSSPDRELYQQSIAEAAASGQPLLVAFSSPAFCTSPTCGPQVETVQELKDRYKDRAGFIHVEVYDNPEEIQGVLERGRYSPAAQAWGFTSMEGYLNESWTFILDRQGRISSKYEGFASAEELEEDLLQVLGDMPS